MSITAELILSIAGVLTALAVIGAAFRWAYKIANRIESNLGIDKEGRSVADRMARVEHQVFPNNGGSLSDQVKDVGEAVIEIRAKTDIIEQLLIGLTTKNTYSNNINDVEVAPQMPSKRGRKSTATK